MNYAFELGWHTPGTWAHDVTDNPLALLSDHAHCELQAAVACQALISRYPDRPHLVDAAALVIEEEMGHFRRVVDLLRKLGGELGDTESNPYADKLRRGLGGTSKSSLMDRLLLASMIERRSCERFEMLAEKARQPELRELYSSLAPEELVHQRLFLNLAESECGVEESQARLAVLIDLESTVAAQVPFANRMHGGQKL
ncbi:MAG: tRNA isopentenyl-2-thiomethyl-A-37 hydroxylase MiaE [Planctomycetota bacterium]|nr:tRNA isopentenyl-2-thiomethyl-A-37 hydroxylase MiaE [Planctomycetota bacterium]MDG2142123.1 tRNA isopentenyl-2-thiomethyl-A-37 hydroxylase MiaE [Planctomycetota bacterium]